MIYEFMEDDSGWVRAEALREGLEPYLGLHCPPSDIPAPARRLFSLTWVRHQPAHWPVPWKGSGITVISEKVGDSRTYRIAK